jgi:putative SOS response-associated peptidase YedK
MCGRAYHTYTDEELEARYITEKRKRKPLADLQPNYNLSPTQIAPIVLMRDEEVTIEPMRWGLVPFWAKDLKSASKYSLINAKAEEITEKRSYQKAFERRRCIVPLSGFFEWKREGEGPKRPFAIYLKDHSILSVAGIWELWESQTTGEVIQSFSIITTQANEFMETIHNRMPVILNQKDEKDWLAPENHDVSRLKEYLKPCSSDWLSAYEVSILVNSPKNNRKEVLDRVAGSN